MMSVFGINYIGGTGMYTDCVRAPRVYYRFQEPSPDRRNCFYLGISSRTISLDDEAVSRPRDRSRSNVGN